MPRMRMNRIKSSNRSIPMMSEYKQLARARDVNNVVVRNLKKRDLPIINQLVFQLISAIDNKEGIDRKVVSRNSRSLSRSDNSHLLVAEIGKTIVGFTHFTTRRTITHRGPSGLIDELVVAKGLRRTGIGRQLLSTTIQRCKELDCCEIEVNTERTNKRARGFHRNCGFEERGILLEKDLT
jgi:GNAT superfamily N-acetyltransferase